KKEAAGSDPAAGATILDADVRPYRDNAAAASDGHGRSDSHERGYKAAPAGRQVMTAIPAGSGVKSPDSTVPGSPGNRCRPFRRCRDRGTGSGNPAPGACP